MKKKAILSILLSGIMAVTCLGGCAGSNEDASGGIQHSDDMEANKDTEENNSSSSSADNQRTESDSFSYPMECKDQLTGWNLGLVNDGTPQVTPSIFAEAERMTGIPLESIVPTKGQEKEQFNLMIASNEFPDIIMYDWLNQFPGGPQKAIDDGLILDLTSLLDQYAPNMKQYLDEHPEVDKQVKTDEGSYYVVPMIRDDPGLLVYAGPCLRKDWLEELNLETPKTIEDWHEVLMAFKEEKNADAPLTYANMTNRGVPRWGAFLGAYGVNYGFYVDQGIVKYGPQEDGYKEFLNTFSQWYSEGLLDKEIATVDENIQGSKMTSGKSGATVVKTAQWVSWISSRQAEEPEYDLLAVPYPVLKEGEYPMFGQRDTEYTPKFAAAVSSSCKNVEAALRWLDFWFTEDGMMLRKYGIEVLSYTMENGEIQATELVYDCKSYVESHPEFLEENPGFLQKYPDGAPRATMVKQLAVSNMPGVQLIGNYHFSFNSSEEYEIFDIWMDTGADETNLPPITLTSEESSKVASIMSNVNTYVDEMYLKFLMKEEPLDHFDSYVEELKKMGIDEAVAAYQSAYDRYSNR